MEPLKIAPMIVDKFRKGENEVRLDMIAGIQFHRKSDFVPPEIIIRRGYYDTYLTEFPHGDVEFAECLNNMSVLMSDMFRKTGAGYLTLIVDAPGDTEPLDVLAGIDHEEVEIARTNLGMAVKDNLLNELEEWARNGLNNPEKLLGKIDQMRNEV
jgi:hypothetical protein